MIFDSILSRLKSIVSESEFQRYIKNIKYVENHSKSDLTVLEVANPFIASWIKTKYSEKIADLFELESGVRPKVEIRIKAKKGGKSRKKDAITTDNKTAKSTILNPAYTFSSFVVGHSNQFAYTVAQSVCEQPGKIYNPLFIYGGVGLGKTHLLQSIGNGFADKGKVVIYATIEQFLNDFTDHLRNQTMDRFREKYRSCDLLIIDDIQFIAGKERTQEEFFHTFNALYDAQKQLVISSDCPPKKIPTLEERLRSRFEWGLIADIQPPDLETKIAILKKKADVENVEIPDEVALFIASKIQSNIRALEGCLIKVAAHSTLGKEPVTLELARRVLEDILETKDSGAKPDITVELIQEIVANHYHLKIEDMKSATRLRTVAFPRQVAMYLARKLTNLSLPVVGQYFGGKDHTTIMYACQKIESMAQTDAVFQKELKKLEESIGS